MTNPFDWRTVVFAKHAQHVALVHFPIALFLAGVAFDGIAAWTKREAFANAAYFNLSAAALTTLPVVLTGLLAWQWQLEGQRPKGILLYHVLFASASAVVILVSWWLRARRDTRTLPPPTWQLLMELVGVVLIMVTGHLGGFLSGVNS